MLSIGCAACPRSAAQSATPTAAPWIECTYSASNQTRTVRVVPTNDPYGVRPLDVAERFLLKLVYVESPVDVAGLRIYAYEIVDEAPPVLLHEAKYPALSGTAAPRGRSELTGEQRIYAHALSRELTYSCSWVRP